MLHVKQNMHDIVEKKPIGAEVFYIEKEDLDKILGAEELIDEIYKEMGSKEFILVPIIESKGRDVESLVKFSKLKL